MKSRSLESGELGFHLGSALDHLCDLEPQLPPLLNGAKNRAHIRGVRPERSEAQKEIIGGFPGGAVVKNPPANAGDTGSISGPGRSHMLRSN